MGIKESPYFNQAKLLIEVLPIVGKEQCFALKGGTAINLFFRDMPRLSVDIDLTYLPNEARDISLNNIQEALVRISKNIQKNGLAEIREFKSDGLVNKLIVSRKDAQIKIEPNTVIRGVVFPCESRVLCAKAQSIFEMFVTMQAVSFGDVFGGKICAALDRQHPRDLFDVKLLLDNEGLTEEVRKGVIVYLLSHPRPMSELIKPSMQDIRRIYEAEFKGMPEATVSYEELVQVRQRLVDILRSEMTNSEKEFLLSFKAGTPQWNLLGLNGVEDLPAVKWKQHNIQRMAEKKKGESLEKLRLALG